LAIWIFAWGLVVIPTFPNFIPFYFLLILALCALLLMRWGIRRARFLLLLVVGLAINTWQLQSLVNGQLAQEFDHQLQTIEFKIVGIPQPNELYTVFVAKVQAIQCSTLPCPELVDRRVRLSWYNPKVRLEPGQVWSATAKLKRPRGLANPGGFDYHAWLLGQDLAATGYVHGKAQPIRNEWTWAMERASIAQRIAVLSSDNQFARFWTTLLVAETSDVTPADWQTLQATGTIHLVAISGSHIALVSLWAFWLGGVFARAAALANPRYAAAVAHWLPPLLSALTAILYTGLAGFSIPTQRALVACLALNVCWAFGLRLGPFKLLGFGVVIVALAEPMAWQNNGFWLSFAAVLLLIHVLSGRVERQSLRIAIGLQLILSLGLAVPLLWLGLGVSWLSPLANLVAVPVITFLIVPGLFVALLVSPLSPELAQLGLSALDWVFALLWQFLQWLEAWPQPLMWSPKPLSSLALGLAFIGVLLLLAPRGLGVRGLGVITIAIGLLLKTPPQPDLRMTVMDVGQGLSVILQTSESTWVYDTGPAFSESFDAGSRILAPYLREMGVGEINLMVSHADNDHSGGVAGLLSSLETKSLWVGEPLDPALLIPSSAVAEEVKPSQTLCRQGQQWQDGPLKMAVLWPPASQSLEGNNASCVLMVELPLPDSATEKSVKILLTGDIDRQTERQLIKFLPESIDVLIAAHHGSKTSSGHDFIEAIKPKVVIFSAGYRNRYNHPHPDIVQRFQRAGSKTYNTAHAGAIVFEWREGIESITETRTAEPKLWYR
jgi:competence protein ComEC